jgi:hypothetical protein
VTDSNHEKPYVLAFFKDILQLNSNLCLYNETSHTNCFSKYYCTAALLMGYDSIQIPYKSEIVICSGKCSVSEVMFQLTCPPLE